MKVTHDGVININDKSLNVAVLEDGTRLITQATYLRSLGRSRSPKAGTGVHSTVDELPFFLQAEALKPFIDDAVREATTPIFYETKTGGQGVGYNAVSLPKVAIIYLKHRDALTAEGKSIPTKYEKMFLSAEILVRGLAEVGMIALVDEATGYQYDREKYELQKILTAYVSDEIAKWQLTFKIDFYKELLRLWNQPFNPNSIKRPSFVGRLTTKFIYEALPNGVLEKIRDKTPKSEGGNYKYRFHQSLTPELGREHLKAQIIEVTALMSVCDTKQQFLDMFEKKYSKEYQPSLSLNEPKQPLTDFNKSLKVALNVT